MTRIARRRSTVQRRSCYTSNTLSDATLGNLHKPLGKVWPGPALLCVADKRNTVQRRSYFTSESLSDATLGDLH